MSVLHKIASALDRKDEIPNLELASELAARKDTNGIAELIAHLDNRDKAIQSDCIKVLYEIGEIDPVLIAPYQSTFLKLLKRKNNRLQWGAMTALDSITRVDPASIHSALPQIIDAMEAGSVITRDHGLFILIHLLQVPDYAEDAFLLLNEQLLRAPVNQLPMYAERCGLHVTGAQANVLIVTLNHRMPELKKESAKKRLEKVMRRLMSQKI